MADAIKLGRSDFGLSQLGAWSLPELKAIYDAHATVLTKHDWETIFLSNHDNPRIVSHFRRRQCHLQQSSWWLHGGWQHACLRSSVAA
jgi:glycosidase